MIGTASPSQFHLDALRDIEGGPYSEESYLNGLTNHFLQIDTSQLSLAQKLDLLNRVQQLWLKASITVPRQQRSSNGFLTISRFLDRGALLKNILLDYLLSDNEALDEIKALLTHDSGLSAIKEKDWENPFPVRQAFHLGAFEMLHLYFTHGAKDDFLREQASKTWCEETTRAYNKIVLLHGGFSRIYPTDNVTVLKIALYLYKDRLDCGTQRLRKSKTGLPHTLSVNTQRTIVWVFPKKSMSRPIEEGTYSSVYSLYCAKIGKTIDTYRDVLSISKVRFTPIEETLFFNDKRRGFLKTYQFGNYLSSKSKNDSKGNFKQVRYYYKIQEMMRDFKKIIVNSIKMPIENLVTITADVTAGLVWLHKNNIVHDDVKPSNILADNFFDKNLTKCQAAIIDFNLSRKSDAAPLSNQVLYLYGSVFYAAPEQLKAVIKTTQFYSDVYALAVSFFEYYQSVYLGELVPWFENLSEYGNSVIKFRKDRKVRLEGLKSHMNECEISYQNALKSNESNDQEIDALGLQFKRSKEDFKKELEHPDLSALIENEDRKEVIRLQEKIADTLNDYLSKVDLSVVEKYHFCLLNGMNPNTLERWTAQQMLDYLDQLKLEFS